MSIKRIIKFVILTAICYMLLAFNVFDIGEILNPETKDFTQTEMLAQEENQEDILSENNTTGHFATDTTSQLDSICEKIDICQKIHFNGTFSDEEKYSYTKIISKIVQFIDSYGTQNADIKEVITDIDINKENGQRRGYATRDSIVFNLGSVQSQKEFSQLSVHEMGHITDLGYIQGIGSKKDKNFTEFDKVVFAIDDLSLIFYKLSRDKETIRKAEAKKKDFCSGYGMSDPFEDFAECFNLYVHHNSFFKTIAKNNTILKQKYNMIAALFDGKYLNTSSQDLQLIKNDPTRRPRDTTKL